MQELRITMAEDLSGNVAFSNFLHALPSSFEDIGREIHRGRNVLKIIDAEGLGLDVEQIVVKRFHGLFWFQKILHSFFCKPKGRKAYDNTKELERRGFRPAHELALVEVWHHGLYQYAFFVAEMVQGERLTALIRRLKNEGQQTAITQIVKQYATLVKNLHEHGVLYRDLNGGNVICRKDESNGQWYFSLVDTNRAVFYDADRSLDLKTATKDLILMKPELGTNELFQEEYLRQRGLYTKESASYLLKAQFARYAKKNRWYRKLLKKYRSFYHRLVEK